MKLRAAIRMGVLVAGAVVVALTCGGVAGAAEYSADVVAKVFRDDGALAATGKGKVYFRDGKVRLETVSQKVLVSGAWRVQAAPPLGRSGTTIMIGRPDLNQCWWINGANRTYTEGGYGEPGGKTVDPMQYARDRSFGGPAIRCTHVGTETIGGLVCDRYDLTASARGSASGAAGAGATVERRWVARKLGAYIKVEKIVNGRCVWRTEHTNIKQGKVPSSVFDLPKGYRKVPPPKQTAPSAPPKGYRKVSPPRQTVASASPKGPAVMLPPFIMPRP